MRLVTALVALFGCGIAVQPRARTQLDIGRVLSEASANPIAIESRYRGSRIYVTGLAQRLGYMTRTETEVQSGSRAAAFVVFGTVIANQSTTTVQRETEHRFAYVAVGTDQAADGTVICLFDEHDDRQAAVLRKGALISVAGDVKKVLEADSDGRTAAAIVMNRCTVEGWSP